MSAQTRTIDAHAVEPKPPQKRAVRDRATEKRIAKGKQALRLGQLLDDRNTGKLGDEVIKIGQAMLLCTLPYSATKENHITRTARLGDGSTLTVTFSTGISDVPLPFGSDRKLLAWVFDRAINSESPMIAWESAWEYQKEMGLKRSGKNNKDLRERFHRISGLNINIERKDASGIAGKNFSIIDTYNLPPSITGQKFNPDQRSFRLTAEDVPELPTAPFGISINQTLFHDIRKHHVAVPRSLWLQAKGNSQVQDMVLWLYYRCYAAKTESVIPWSALARQFPQDKIHAVHASTRGKQSLSCASCSPVYALRRPIPASGLIRRLRRSCSTTLQKVVCGASVRESKVNFPVRQEGCVF